MCVNPRGYLPGNQTVAWRHRKGTSGMERAVREARERRGRGRCEVGAKAGRGSAWVALERF